MTTRLRSGLELRRDPSGRPFVVEASGREHLAPEPLAEKLGAAIAAGSTADEITGRWLDARHLADTERARAVETWGAAKVGGERPIVVHPESKFTCHGCGSCCESYVPAPVSEAERQAIEDGADELAPHVSAPRERWFEPWRPERGRPTFALGRHPDGKCVFLGADKLCLIHAKLGSEVKPFFCRRFPLSVARWPDATVVTVRAECETLHRSRKDGLPLSEQRAWVEAIARGDSRALEVPAIVRLYQDAYIPAALARAVEGRALRFVREAPNVELGLLAVRDLVFAVTGSVGVQPDVAVLERALLVATRAPLGELAKACGEISPHSSIEALRAIVTVLKKAMPKFLGERERQPVHGPVPRANDRFFADVIDRVASLVPDPRALVPPIGDDPAVHDFVRQAFLHSIASGLPTVASPGLLHGYGMVALAWLFARHGAALLAERESAKPGPAHWNHALSVIERSLGMIDFASMDRVVIAFFQDLYAIGGPS